MCFRQGLVWFSQERRIVVRMQGTFSLNAAMFAAVLLASRLESNQLVFSFILLACELFALLPFARSVPHRP